MTKDKATDIANKVYDLASKESDTKPIAVLVLFPDDTDPDYMYTAVSYDTTNDFEDVVTDMKAAITNQPKEGLNYEDR